MCHRLRKRWDENTALNPGPPCPLSWSKQTAILVSQTFGRQEARVQGTSGAVRQSAEDLQRCDNGCSVSY